MENRVKIALRVSAVSIAVNIALTVFKFVAGILSGSIAMLSDAAHTLSDVLTSFIVIAGVKAGAKKADRNHPYGHERLECVASIVLAVFLVAVAFGIGYAGVSSMTGGGYKTLKAPGLIALIAAIVSIAVKEGMFWFTRHYAVKIDSGALKADAWHHRSDALSSIGSFVGILGARLGLPILDPIASLVICALILKAGLSVFIDAVKKMTDESADPDTVKAITDIIMSVDGVIEIQELKTRKFGDRVYVETTIALPDDMSFYKAHEITDIVHDKLETEMPKIKHCCVHAHPGTECKTE